MDRYIVREPRAGAECLQGNQIIAFPTSTAGNNMIPETFYTPYGSEFQNVRENRYLPHKSYQGNMMQGQTPIMSGIDPTYLAAYSNNNAQFIATGHQQMHREMQMERQMQFRSDPSFGSDYQNRSLVHADKNNCKTFAHTVSCESPRQLESNTTRVNNYENKLKMQNRPPSPSRTPSGHQQMHREMQMERQMQFRSDPSFGSDYQNRSLVHADKNNCKTFAHTVSCESPRQLESNTTRVNNYENKLKMQNRPPSPSRTPSGHQQMHREMQMERQMQFRSDPSFGSDYQNRSLVHADKNNCKTFAHTVSCESPRQLESNTTRVNNYENKLKMQNRPPSPSRTPSVPPKKPNETETPKNELQSQVLTRFDKLKMLHKNGPRVFTGPIEKVLKWHKALQDIGVLIIYEIIAKCVSIQPGKSYSKILVVRDDHGPAMQVVYYEIDFLLPELKPPCTVRVVGRMIPGTCRLQAFTVRPATGDDVATLPRRAAVASHHVTKMCKEFGPNVDKV